MINPGTEGTVVVDVDDTLIMHSANEDTSPHPVTMLDIECPYTKEWLFVRVHAQNIRLLKEKKARGSYIIVWSQGGNRWAEAVVKALGLEQHVDLVLTKPVMYIDDLPANEWMGARVWLPLDKPYKGAK